jgi:hypothetical protein
VFIVLAVLLLVGSLFGRGRSTRKEVLEVDT